jgi:hypothetical protein
LLKLIVIFVTPLHNNLDKLAQKTLSLGAGGSAQQCPKKTKFTRNKKTELDLWLDMPDLIRLTGMLMLMVTLVEGGCVRLLLSAYKHRQIRLEVKSHIEPIQAQLKG